MRRFTTRFSFEIQGVPAKSPQEAATKALQELALRLQVKKGKEGLFRVFLGRHEIGRVFLFKEKDHG